MNPLHRKKYPSCNHLGLSLFKRTDKPGVDWIPAIEVERLLSETVPVFAKLDGERKLFLQWNREMPEGADAMGFLIGPFAIPPISADQTTPVDNLKPEAVKDVENAVAYAQENIEMMEERNKFAAEQGGRLIHMLPQSGKLIMPDGSVRDVNKPKEIQNEQDDAN